MNDFIKLSAIIDGRYAIVLVGLSETQINQISEKIIAISRTNSTRELAEIYTAADVFFNPTYEDNYPTVNLEAEACGTPVVTYRTGGAPGTIHRNDSVIVEVGAFVDLLQQEVLNLRGAFYENSIYHKCAISLQSFIFQ